MPCSTCWTKSSAARFGRHGGESCPLLNPFFVAPNLRPDSGIFVSAETALFRRLRGRIGFFKMRHDIVEDHHVGIFVVHVEQVDLVRDFRPVEDAFLCDGRVIPIGVSIDDGGADASRRALAADDQAVDAQSR